MALPVLKGRIAFVFEEIDFDVDQIVGVKNIKITDVDELAAAAMQEYDLNFRSTVRKGESRAVSGVCFIGSLSLATTGTLQPRRTPSTGQDRTNAAATDRAANSVPVTVCTADGPQPSMWTSSRGRGFAAHGQGWRLSGHSIPTRHAVRTPIHGLWAVGMAL